METFRGLEPLLSGSHVRGLLAVGGGGGGGGGCGALPAWPTLQELEGAGFVVDVSIAEVVLGQVLGIAGGLVFAPQAVKLASLRSVEGTSLLMVLTSMMATCLQLATITVDTSPTFLACSRLAFGRCFVNTLPFQQVFWQAVGTTGLFLTYMAIRRLPPRAPTARLLNPHDGGAPGRARKAGWFAAVCFVLTMVAVALYAVIPFCLGPCSDALPAVRDAAALVATVLQVVVMLPQLQLLCMSGDIGSLSLVSVTGQGLGCFIYAADMVLERAELMSILPFFVMGSECMLVLGLAAYYGCRARRRSRCSTGISLGVNSPGCASPASL